MLLLDSLIRLFSLTTLDADLKRSRASAAAQTQYNAGLIPGAFTDLDSTLLSMPTSLSPGATAVYPGAAAPGFFQSQFNDGTTMNGGGSSFPGAPFVPPPAEPLVPDNLTLGPSTTPPPPACNLEEEGGGKEHSRCSTPLLVMMRMTMTLRRLHPLQPTLV